MATVEHRIREHDVVALRAAIGRWPAGTVGTVVSLYPDARVLLEVADPHGRTVDLVRVPTARLNAAPA
jgi:Domain of unknown function (DUF4926)